MKEKLPKLVSKINTSRTIALVLSLLLCISIIGIIASAASVTKDGLEVTLVTDKEEYSASEPITATLTVENKSDKSVDAVSLETLIPDGYHTDSTTPAAKTVGALGVGEKAVLEVVLLPEAASEPDTPVAPGPISPSSDNQSGEDSANHSSSTTENTSKESANGSTTKTKKSSTASATSKFSSTASTAISSTNGTASSTGSSAISSKTVTSVKSVDTEDGTHLRGWAILASISVVLLCLTNIIKRNKAKQLLSVLLTLGIIGDFLVLPIITGKSEEREKTISISVDYKCGESKKSIEGIVCYVVENAQKRTLSTGDDSVWLIDDNNIDYDSEEKVIFYNDCVFAFLSEDVGDSVSSEIADLIQGEVVGKLSGIVNYIQIKIPVCSFEEICKKINVLQEHPMVVYSSYETPIEMVDNSIMGYEDENPWPSGVFIIKESDKGNESHPAGNDWWAEAVRAYSAWKYTPYVSDITVGIIDGGFYNHDDVTKINEGSFLPDFKANTATTHGTQVAGIIAADNNNIGIRGISDRANLLLADWTPRNGVSYLSNSLYLYVTKQMLDNGAKVVNNSWGKSYSAGFIETITNGDESFKNKLENSYQSSYFAQGFLLELLINGFEDFIIVQSAGNGVESVASPLGVGVSSTYNGYYCSIDEYSFSEMMDYVKNEKYVKAIKEKGITYNSFKDHLLIVGAVENNAQSTSDYYMTSFSNFGPGVDICAPGQDVMSTSKGSDYSTLLLANSTGTSFSAPIVSGAAALLWSLNPNLHAGDIKALLRNSDKTALGVNGGEGTTYPMLDIAYSIEHSPFYNNLNTSEQPSTPGDISGIDDPEPTQNNNGHYYKVFDDDLTWDEAKSICESYGGHLVTITSQKENDIVSDLIKNVSMGAYWIGAQRDDNWKWITGEDFTYSSWQPNRPDNNEQGMVIQIFNNNVYENQLGLWDDTWTDGDHAAGLREQGYVCEWDSKQAYDNGFGFASGSGTEEDPYVITTPAELNHVRHHLSSSFILGNDIDMAAWNTWEPIGKSEYEKDFAGVFDGNNKTIKNLHLGKNADKESNHALFGEVSGTLKNIIIDNLSITINHEELIHDGEIENWYQLVGGLLLHGGNIDNCKVSGNITVSSLTTPVIEGGAGLSIGGISAGSSNIRNCESNVNIRVTKIEKDISISAGGISGDGGVIYNCINKGTISTENLFYGMLGGIVGEGFWSKITSCSNYGDIKNTLSDISLKEEYLYGEFLNVGGIAGRTGTAYDVETIISNCYNYASCVQNDGSSTRVGRIFGDWNGPDENSLEISNNFSVKSTLVNGVIPTEDIAANQKNGANL